MLLTDVSRREGVRRKNEVQKIDPEALVTVSVVSEVRGRGFSSAQVPLPPAENIKEEEPQEIQQ